MLPQPEHALLVALGARLRLLRAARKMSQERLAERVNVDELTISRIETGKRGMSALLALKIAKVLEVPIETLLALDAPSKIPDISVEDAEWIDIWRGLEPERRRLALRLMREYPRYKEGE